MIILDQNKASKSNSFFFFILANYLTIGLEIMFVITIIGFIVGLYGIQDNPSNLLLCIGLLIFGILFLLLLIQKCVVLPIAYHFIEKYAQETIILDFIHNLKSSWKWKIGVLLILSIVPGILSKDVSSFTFFLFISPVPSYLALYLWWWIEDKIKKRKNPLPNF